MNPVVAARMLPPLSLISNIHSILQDTLSLSYDTLNDAFIHIGGKISDFNDLKKRTVVLEIERRRGKDIIKEGARKIA